MEIIHVLDFLRVPFSRMRKKIFEQCESTVSRFSLTSNPAYWKLPVLASVLRIRKHLAMQNTNAPVATPNESLPLPASLPDLNVIGDFVSSAWIDAAADSQ